MLNQIPERFKGFWPQLYFLAATQKTGSLQIEGEIRKYPRLLRRFLSWDLLAAHDLYSMLPVTPHKVVSATNCGKEASFRRSFADLSPIFRYLSTA